MTVSPPSRRAALRSRAIALLALVLGACSAPSIDAPLVSPTAPAAARAPVGPAVTSTSPSFGKRGTTVDVRVLGSGFTVGAQATWLLRGVADPARVRTNSTTYVSSTELVANITIASDADLALWDVQVALAGGKNGVGTESFEVTTAEPLGPVVYVNAMNDAGQIVGGTSSSALIYDDAFGMLTLGAGQGWGIDPLGTMVLGRDGSNVVTAWVRQGTTSTYVAERLPGITGSIGGNAVTAARDATGALLVGGWQTMPGKKGTSGLNRPVRWRHDGTWSAPTPLVLPSGATTGSARGINRLGQIVGRLDSSDLGAVWDDPATPVRLDGLPDAINSAGTFIVGARGGQPAYWTRSASGAWTTVGTVLPSLGGTCGGEAIGLNDDGIVVGKSCDTRGNLQATLWRLDLSGAAPVLLGAPQRLPGLGGKHAQNSNESSLAARVTGTMPYVVAGVAFGSGTTTAVRWRTW
jgi:uncharacterized membrane protein